MRCLLLLFFAWGGLRAGLVEVRAVANPEQRAQRALDNAMTSVKSAQSDYAAGNTEAAGKDLHEVEESVDLARASLAASGKTARKNPGAYKRAETQSRVLLRRIEGLEQSMDFDDRKLVDGAKAKAQEAHDKWLEDLFAKH